MTIKDLYQIILDRKNRNPKNSYTVSLLQKGEDAILQKIGEEATEVILAAKNQEKKEITFEISDLIYHIVVLMASENISIEDIEKVLESRNKK